MIVVAVTRFLAGAFLANAVPHGTAALRGREFPSPFATPPGVGPSSPRENAAWSLTNLVVGAALLLAVRRRPGTPAWAAVGATLMGGFLGWWFAPARREARLLAVSLER